MHDYDRPFQVTGYDPNGPVKNNLCTVFTAMAYDDAVTGETVILLVHQAIRVPDLDHNLLAPMQRRTNDVTVNDVPRFLTENPTMLTHCSFVIPTDDPTEPYVIPMTLHGVASSFPTRKPTIQPAVQNAPASRPHG